MDKNNEYYEIIVNLVKQHRKFPEYEAILDDIVDDVYSHSEIIINSVKNEDVVRSYLEKVISTSMVTVPKKLGIRKYVKSINVIKQKEESPEKTEPEVSLNNEETLVLEEEPVVKKADPDLVEKMINSAEVVKEASEEVILPEENYDVLTEETEDLQDEAEDEFLEAGLQEEPENVDVQKEIEEVNVTEDNSEDEFLYEKETEVPEESLSVDEDIIEVAEEELPFGDDEKEEVADTGFYEPIEAIDDYETLENNDEIENVSDIDNEKDKDSQVEVLSLDDEQNDTSVSIDIIDSPEEMLQMQEENNEEEIVTESSEDSFEEILPEIDTDVNVSGEESSDDLISFEGNEELSVSEDLSEINEYSDDLSSELISSEEIADDTDDLNLLDSLDDIQIDEESSFLQEEDDKEIQNSVSKVQNVDYDIFKYEKGVVYDNQDLKEFGSEILLLNKKNPEMHIVEIFNLRYKQKNSVENIAKELNMSEKDVYAALTAMADLV